MVRGVHEDFRDVYKSRMKNKRSFQSLILEGFAKTKLFLEIHVYYPSLL